MQLKQPSDQVPALYRGGLTAGACHNPDPHSTTVRNVGNLRGIITSPGKGSRAIIKKGTEAQRRGEVIRTSAMLDTQWGWYPSSQPHPQPNFSNIQCVDRTFPVYGGRVIPYSLPWSWSLWLPSRLELGLGRSVVCAHLGTALA